MGLLSLTLPTIGQPNATEDSKVRDALSSIQTEFNGNIELTNISASLQELFIPTATVLPYASSVAPSGFLICDGAEVSRGTYSALFTKIDVLYGAGDGSTTFNLPDLRGRSLVGKGTNADVSTLGDNEGLATESDRTPKHWHDADNLSGRVFGANQQTAGNGGFTVPLINTMNQNSYASNFGLVDVTGDVGVTSASQDTPSFLVMNYIIKT